MNIKSSICGIQHTCINFLIFLIITKIECWPVFKQDPRRDILTDFILVERFGGGGTRGTGRVGSMVTVADFCLLIYRQQCREVQGPQHGDLESKPKQGLSTISASIQKRKRFTFHHWYIFRQHISCSRPFVWTLPWWKTSTKFIVILD